MVYENESINNEPMGDMFFQVHYHLKDLMSELQQTNLEKTLLAWCRQNTQVVFKLGILIRTNQT